MSLRPERDGRIDARGLACRMPGGEERRQADGAEHDAERRQMHAVVEELIVRKLGPHLAKKLLDDN
jgi:hypothetical protein